MQKLTYFNYLPVYIEYEKGSPIGLSIITNRQKIELTYNGKTRDNVLGLLNKYLRLDDTIEFEDDNSFAGVLCSVIFDNWSGKIYAFNGFIEYDHDQLLKAFIMSELKSAGVPQTNHIQSSKRVNPVIPSNIIAGNIPHFDARTGEMEDYYHHDDDCVEIEEPKDEPEFDIVEKPEHYNSAPNGIETIDAIEAALTPEEFRGYLKGTSLKYVFRLGKKDKATQDLGKSQWYLNKLMKKLEELEGE